MSPRVVEVSWLNRSHGYSLPDIYSQSGGYEPPKAARSGQLRRTAFAFTRI